MNCSIHLASSLDGFIARKGGEVDWLSRVERPGEDYGFNSFFATVDVLVMGRNSYDVLLGEGTRFTQPFGADAVLALRGHKVFESGLLQLRCGLQR